MTNAFGQEVYDIKNILADPGVAKTVTSMLVMVLSHLDMPDDQAGQVAGYILGAAAQNDMPVYEKTAHDFLEAEGVLSKIPEKLSTRAETIFGQIKPYLKPGKVLDLGAGDGRVGQLLARSGYRVSLADVYRHPHIEQTGLEFELFVQGQEIPFEENEFDDTLLLTVFHHSSDPVQTLQDAHRVTKRDGRVIVIESVYGITNAGTIDGPVENSYIALPEEKQRMVNIFFDHFYNRVVHYAEDPSAKVNVPFNFNTPAGWRAIFEANGFIEETMVLLGIDQPVVPEYHTMHVLRVLK